MLRNEPPFGPLRVRQLSVSAIVRTADAVLALAADLAAHASLTSVWLYNAPLDAPGALDAVVDAALARRLSSVWLSNCNLWPASAPALARLLGSDTLTELYINKSFEQLLDEPAATLLVNALRANTTLTALSLAAAQLWHNAAAAAELLGVLTAHPWLRLLDLSCNNPYVGVHAADVHDALAALLRANTPALQTLNIGSCGLGDAGMYPVLQALRHNTHLTKQANVPMRMGSSRRRRWWRRARSGSERRPRRMQRVGQAEATPTAGAAGAAGARGGGAERAECVARASVHVARRSRLFSPMPRRWCRTPQWRRKRE